MISVENLYTNHEIIFIIGKFLGPSSLGVYSIALQLASLPLEKVGQIINQIAFPAYSEIQGDHERVAQYTLRIGNLISMLSFPLFFGICCLDNPVLSRHA